MATTTATPAASAAGDLPAPGQAMPAPAPPLAGAAAAANRCVTRSSSERRERRRDRRALGGQQQRDLGQLGVLGRRPARRPASRRSRRAWRAISGSIGSSGQAVALQAFLSFSIVRYSSVPAFDSLTPSTRASSALDSPAWNFSATISRSRARQRGQRGCGPRCGAARPRRRPRRARRPTSSGSADQRGEPPAPAKLVERRVAGDPEQPRPLLAAAAIEGAPAPVGALEGERGHVLGGGRIAQQRARRTRTRRRGWSGTAPRTAPTSSRRRGRQRVGLGHTPTTHDADDPSRHELREQPRVVCDHAGDPERLERPEPRSSSTVHTYSSPPAARTLAHEPGRHQPPVRHQRVAPPRRGSPARRATGSTARNACRATSAGSRVARERNGSRVASAPTSRACTRGSAARSARGSPRYWRRDQRPLEQRRRAQRLEHAQLVAGQLEVDVELDGRERVGRRGGRAPRSSVCGARATRRPPSRGRGSALAVSSRSTSNSIMSTPASSAASKLANVLPGAIRSAPLWPTPPL